MILTLAVGSAVALAEEAPLSAAEEAATFVPGWTSISDLEAASADAAAVVLPGPETNPEIAEALPHQDLNRTEALELAIGVFGDVIDEPASVFDDLELRGFRSDHVAVVEPEQSGAPDGDTGEVGLLSSVLPLWIAGEDGVKEPVALDLESAEGELQPQNPLVDVGVPMQIGDEISLPESGISIELVGAPERAASTIAGGSAVFYPNIAPDSDLIVAPAATGFETFTQLRSAEAPREQVFKLELPATAELEATEDGGAIVKDGGSELLSVRPPSGIDAEGNPVPVELEVAAGSITVSADPTPQNAYPLLIDPIFESYYWDQYPNDYSPEWHLDGNGNPFWATWNTHTGGLLLWSFAGAITPPSQATANYYVPRFFTDMAQVGSRPTSYVKQINLTQAYFSVLGEANYTQPFAQMGLWSENKGQWVSHGVIYSNQASTVTPGFVFELVNPNEVTDVKNGGISLGSFENASHPRQFGVRQATVEISDRDSPGFGVLGNASGWMHEQPTAAINYKVSDPGLGIYDLRVTQPAASGTNIVSTSSAGCLGSARTPCPRTLEASQVPLKYDPKVMPQGENWLRVVARDPVLHQSAGESRVKVDHTKPTLALSGTLTEQANVGTTAQQYNLKYEAGDGDSAAVAAQAPFGAAGTGVGQLQRPMGIAADSAGNTYVADRDCKCVQKYDPAGNFVMQLNAAGLAESSQKFSDPRGIAVSPTGDIWVADLGNRRVYQLDPAGNLLRTLKPDVFVQPYAVATGPEGVVWVSDIGAQTVFKFVPSSGEPERVFGTEAAPSGQSADLKTPSGLAVDASGTVWVTDTTLNRITAYGPNRGWVSQVGSYSLGGSNAVFNLPLGIATAPVTGNLLVVDAGNHRVVELRSNGEYIRQFGVLGAASNQLNEPRGLALGPNRTAYIADAGNKRIAKWTHASYDPQSGVASTEVKIDGNLVEPKHAPGCATKDCAISREWTLNADQFSVGQHTLEVTATDGVGLSSSKSMMIETHGDLTAPTVALSGSMTEQASLGTTRPAYTLKVNASDPGGAEERKSGVASTTIKVDGATVDTTSPGCPAGGCSIAREWTLNSNSYSVGAHSLQVIATDAAGRTTIKTLSITINRDTTAPEIETIGIFNSLFNRPEGWIEQKSYFYRPVAKDPNGYGVASLVVKFDGASINSKTQNCSAGACEANLLGSLNGASYAGGAHTAEVLATDGAGNTRKRTWTINVNPTGEISAQEAQDTLEAVEKVWEDEIVTPEPIPNDPEYIDTDLKPRLEEESGSFHTVGSPNETTFGDDADGGFTVHTADGAFAVKPTEIGPDATEIQPASDAAAISGNTESATDTVVRPLYDGAMTFQSIRQQQSPETFSWEVELHEGQYLEQINDQSAVVFWDPEHPAFSINIIRAHDATGAAVPTTLAVSEGSVITLTVHHKAGNPAAGGASYVYPVVAGTGWEGGFTTHVLAMPPEEEPQSAADVLNFSVSAPIPADSQDPDVATVSGGGLKFIKTWAAYKCGLGICESWEHRMRGFFWYNGSQAWYPTTRDPVCTKSSAPNFTLEKEECDWIGPNHQPFQVGLWLQHITARTHFTVTSVPTQTEDQKNFSVYGFANGEALAANTPLICNPLKGWCNPFE